MASRTKQKEQARARRLAEERARLERERRNRRMRMIGGVVLAAAAVLAVVIALSSLGGNNASGLQTGTKATHTINEVQQLLNGIPQSGATLGNPKAPVTMTYYGDLQCPFCRDFTVSGGLPQLIANEVRSGKVKVVYKAFETATRDPSVFQTQQVAALAAGKQNRFWDYAELFYRQQGGEGTGYVTENYLQGLARQVPGLDFNAWKTARSDPSLASQVQADGAAGQSAGVSGTPTLIMAGPKGAKAVSSGTAVPSYSDLQNTLKQVS